MHPPLSQLVQFPPLAKMLANSTNLDVDSIDHEHSIESVHDCLLQRDGKESSKNEERVARAQFLALCWTLFVVGWTDGSTGPLLPRIQNFYDVSSVGLFF